MLDKWQDVQNKNRILIIGYTKKLLQDSKQLARINYRRDDRYVTRIIPLLELVSNIVIRHERKINNNNNNYNVMFGFPCIIS